MLTASKVAEFFENLASMKIIVDIESADRVLTDVYRLATLHRLAAYDPSYLELALRRNLPIATLGVELRAASAAAGVVTQIRSGNGGIKIIGNANAESAAPILRPSAPRLCLPCLALPRS